ncbi:hypothetical protein SBOR_9118 [Sclerotinia borealis F-4128]|uniref:Pentatricopeptide repeat-containing protein-mitochondrial domain-containing protein n=1 Tax=Sclerotinia borealis (strain F-4128) TaxID=1432307 RepID=W9C451_SCLBF|nr:hypothetical protein SBOR_9118 [Sclerotinia borealis F-4128]
MTATRIPIDGLWRCLCPSINTFIFARPVTFNQLPRKVLNRPLVKNKKLPTCLKRPFHTTTAHSLPVLNGQYVPRSRHHKPKIHGPKPINLGKLNNEEIHDRLRQLKTEEGAYSQVAEVVEYLVKVRQEKPALIHYDALIAANADAEHGSAEVVRTLLEEMKGLRIGGDSGLYHTVLQVLAIHPDYLLRTQILEEMKERWYGLSPTGWHNLVIGLLRDRQYEMVMDKFEQMQASQIEIQPWLYDILFFRLCELDELDETLRLLQTRYQTPPLTMHMYYHMLDSFASAFHYEGTSYIWRLFVETSEINPADGTCTAVLNCAARHADPNLATSAIGILSKRSTVLGVHHYEALLDAYVGAQDIKTSFRILNIMTKAGLTPDANSTRSIYLFLTSSSFQALAGWDILKSLKKDGYTIPIAAVNVVLEAVIVTNNISHNTDHAMNIYKELHTICDVGPNIETFNTILRGLGHYSTGSKPKAMFLASEIQALNLKPDELTYDRLILICLQPENADFDDCFRYLEEMMLVGKDKVDSGGRRGWWMRPGTVVALVKRCVENGDERCWQLMEDMKERGMANEYTRLQVWTDIHWPQKGGRASFKKGGADGDGAVDGRKDGGKDGRKDLLIREGEGEGIPHIPALEESKASSF